MGDYVFQVESVHKTLQPDLSPTCVRVGTAPAGNRRVQCQQAGFRPRTVAKSNCRPSSNTPASPLPEWGSGAPSRYGRDCTTSPQARSPPCNTSWRGCSPISAPSERGGFESNEPSLGNPLVSSNR